MKFSGNSKFTLFGITDSYMPGSHTKIIQFIKIRCEDHRLDAVELTMDKLLIGNEEIGNQGLHRVK